MKRLALIIASALASLTVSAQALTSTTLIGSLTGIPVGKTSKQVLSGAIATITDSADKTFTRTRVCTENGFQFRAEYGSYRLVIKAEGYDDYKLEVDIDSQETDLGFIRMITKEEAAKKAAKKARKHAE